MALADRRSLAKADGQLGRRSRRESGVHDPTLIGQLAPCPGGNRFYHSSRDSAQHCKFFQAKVRQWWSHLLSCLKMRRKCLGIKICTRC
jgi:hypothetical protein